jgi:hypothetical protein
MDSPDSYRGSHQPDTAEDAVRFHELDKAMPDFYDRPHDYIWDLGEPEHLSDQFKGHHQAIRQALNARGNPDARVSLFRAVPKGVKEINTGDWVSTSKQYAREHAAISEDPSEDMDVLLIQTKAHNITFGGNDAFEFGYVGPTKHGKRL